MSGGPGFSVSDNIIRSLISLRNGTAVFHHNFIVVSYLRITTDEHL